MPRQSSKLGTGERQPNDWTRQSAGRRAAERYGLPMEQFRRGELVFDVIDAGPADGPVVVLLHGFPEQNTMWQSIIPRLTAQGYRCLAPRQRGYSPGARPKRRRDYRVGELARGHPNAYRREWCAAGAPSWPRLGRNRRVARRSTVSRPPALHDVDVGAASWRISQGPGDEPTRRWPLGISTFSNCPEYRSGT